MNAIRVQPRKPFPNYAARGLGDAACPTAAELAAEQQRQRTAEAQVSKREGQITAMRAEIADITSQVNALRSRPIPTNPTPRPTPPTPTPTPPADPNCPTEAQLAAEQQRQQTAVEQANRRADQVVAMQAEIAALERQIREWTQRNNATYRANNAALRQQVQDVQNSTEATQTRVIAQVVDADATARERAAGIARVDAQPSRNALAPIVVNPPQSSGGATGSSTAAIGIAAVVGIAVLMTMSGKKGKRR